MDDIHNIITDNIDIWTSAIEKKNATGRGSSKKHSLHGIKKLRELILDLAVRGKLVPQDPTDEPASVLLEKIKQEKEQLIKDKKIKKSKTLPEITDVEIPFDLPKGWEWSNLDSISLVNPRNIIVGDIDASFVSMPMISTKYNGEHDAEVRTWSTIRKGYTHFADGDIGVAKITPCFENSKAVVFSNLKNGVGAGTTELHVSRPLTKDLSPFFILLYLKSPQFLNVGKGKMTGSAGQKRIPKDFFSYNPFPLPPENEQKRIVSKVNELMDLCDKLEQETEDSIEAHKTLVKVLLNTLTNSTNHEELTSNWNRISEYFNSLFTTEESIEQLKQTILQLVVMGKLVPQDPTDEPASVLLEKIKQEKEQLIKDKKIKKPKKLPEITEEEIPFDIPEGWIWCRLGQLTIIRGGKRLPKGSGFEDHKTPFVYIRVSDMKNGTIDLSDLQYISEEVYDTISNYIITVEDIYMTIVGATIGKCGIIPTCLNNMNLTENAARITPILNINKDYLLKILECKYSQEQFFDKTKQVGVQKMALHRLSSTLIPIAPKEEQIRIVAKVYELLSLCDQLSDKLKVDREKKVLLADSMVKSLV